MSGESDNFIILGLGHTPPCVPADIDQLQMGDAIMSFLRDRHFVDYMTTKPHYTTSIPHV